MKKNIDSWTMTDRFIFGGLYALTGGILGWAIALFVAKYISSEWKPEIIIVLTVLFLFGLGFLFPQLSRNTFSVIRRLFLFLS